MSQLCMILCFLVVNKCMQIPLNIWWYLNVKFRWKVGESEWIRWYFGGSGRICWCPVLCACARGSANILISNLQSRGDHYVRTESAIMSNRKRTTTERTSIILSRRLSIAKPTTLQLRPAIIMPKTSWSRHLGRPEAYSNKVSYLKQQGIIPKAHILVNSKA